jgi:hypothetical protein
MWMLSDSERVLTHAEWVCLRIGLASLRDYIADDPDGSYGFSITGVQVFDRLSAPQKLAILADTCEAMTQPDVPAPTLTAVNEGTVAALLQSFWNQLVVELDMCDDFDDDDYPLLECRRALLSAYEDDEDPDTQDMLPYVDETDSEMWHDLFTLFESRFLDDTDYEMAALLDLPAEKSEEVKAIMGIDDEYFVGIAPDPTERQMHKVNQKLAKLLDLPCPDDDGRFPAISDLYNGLVIGPCTPQQTAQWSKNPWIEATTLERPSWDCDYEVWRCNFLETVLAADPSEAVESPQLNAQRELRRKAALDSLGGWPAF